jgi:predicted HNH restriction endonuclease
LARIHSQQKYEETRTRQRHIRMAEGPRGGTEKCDECRLKKRGAKTRESIIRARAIAAYGGRCDDCGLDDDRILEMHHVNGGGARERKEKGAYRLFADAAKTGMRDDSISLLCPNCHSIRHWQERHHQ